jgi:serine protease Do
MRLSLGIAAFCVMLLLGTAAVAQQEEPEPKDSNPLAKLEETFQKAAAKVKDAVVSVEVERDTSVPELESDEEEAAKPAIGPDTSGGRGLYHRRPKGPVSGVVISEDGYVITSYFNVRGNNIKKITITLPDGRRLEAKRLGWDENLDVAVLKAEAADLEYADFSRSDHLKPGHFVIVVGRGDDRLSLTENSGIVSALNRLEGRAVQIDAALNYGNSGGAVVDIDGKVVGIACHVSDKSVTGQNSGVGFMTPPEKLQENLPFLKRGAVIKKEKKPFLGVSAMEGAEDVQGAQVAEVLDNTPAARAGMQNGDIIIEFNGMKVTDWDSLRQQIALTRVGDKVKVKVKRAEGEKELEVTMGERP